MYSLARHGLHSLILGQIWSNILVRRRSGNRHEYPLVRQGDGSNHCSYGTRLPRTFAAGYVASPTLMAPRSSLAYLACAWRINRIKRLSEFGTSLDSASATDTNRDQSVIQLLPQAVPAGALPAPHAFDARYSTVENRLASPPDRLWSRIRLGRDTRGESCRSMASLRSL